MRVLVLAHRRELVGQMSRRLHGAGIDHGIIAAGFKARPGEPVQIASIQTLDARAMRTRQMDLPPADLVVVDECHHATADSWRRIIDAYPRAAVLGLTATPCRKSGTGLGDVFHVLVQAPQTAAQIEAGYLVRTKVVGPPEGPDLSGVRSRGGDYVESEAAARVDRPELVGDAVTEWLRHAEGSRTIIYTASLAHMVHVRDAFRAAGVLAECLDGTTPTEERDGILKQLASGTIDVIVNCGVLTEGFDCPTVSCIVLLRPTKSFGLYLQMIGRGLRSAEGKRHCMVIDHVGATATHGFVEEEVDWTLDTKTRAQSRSSSKARAAGTPRELATCPECSANYWRGQPCGACGWRSRSRAEAVEFVDADLVELKRDGRTPKATLTADQKIGFYRQLLWIAREHGYSDGWAWHKVNEKFGERVRTPRHSQPLEPTPEVWAWVRSRMIAYAKGRAKAGAAT